jgi:hypothetical protein
LAKAVRGKTTEKEAESYASNDSVVCFDVVGFVEARGENCLVPAIICRVSRHDGYRFGVETRAESRPATPHMQQHMNMARKLRLR